MTVSTLTCPPLTRSSPYSAIFVLAVSHESLIPTLASWAAPFAFCSILPAVPSAAITYGGAATIATDAHTMSPITVELRIVLSPCSFSNH